MTRFDDITPWHCPFSSCRSPIEPYGDTVRCRGSQRHGFAVRNGYPCFAPSLTIGKYDADYAAKYTFLWSYGYETLQTGLVEGLYRTTAALTAEALGRCGSTTPVVLDCGCGAGRVAADVASLIPSGRVLSLDASPFQLDIANDILRGLGWVERSFPDLGFSTTLRISARSLRNVFLAQSDAFAMPVSSHEVDVLISVDVIDRLGHDPANGRTLAKFLEEVRRVLRPGGYMVLLSPLNWLSPDEWLLYPDSVTIRRLIEDTGFTIMTHFDQLLYRHLVDARGSVHEFTTAVIVAQLL